MNINEIEKLNNLSKIEAKILENIIARINESDEKILIRDVADSTFVSTTSVVRLAKKLGYNGYSDMIYALREKYSSNSSVAVQNPYSSLVVNECSLSGVYEFEQDLISKKYSRVYILGIGYSNMAAIYFRDKLLELNFNALTLSPLDCAPSSSENLMLFISKSGETSDNIHIAERCKDKNFKMYAFTGSEKNTTAKLADINIIVKTSASMNSKYPDYFIPNCLLIFEKVLSEINSKMEEYTTC